MNIFQSINAVWQRISLVQRAIIIALVMACVAVSVLLPGWAGKGDMRPLYTNLNYEQAGKISDKLAESGIEYQLGQNGTSIFVNHNKVHQARMMLAKEGLPDIDQGGYSILNNSKIGSSPLVQQMNQKQALEEELAKSIQMISGIEYARVLLVCPEDALFNPANSQSKASVTVQLRAGWALSQSNIAAIRNLTASSIEGLMIDNVTIVDSTGRLLTSKENDGFASGANSYHDYKSRVENDLALKVQNMLETILGPGRSTVKISADIDMTTVTTQETDYDSKGTPTKEITDTTESIKASPVAKSEDGSQQTTTMPSSTEKEKKIQSEMLVGQTITSKVSSPGQIQNLSVSVVVDLSIPKPQPVAVVEGEETTEAPTDQAAPQLPEKVMTIDQVRDIVKNALGRRLLTEDTMLTVVDAPFVQTRMLTQPKLIVADTMNIDKYLDIIKQASMPIMAFCALVIFVILSKGAKKQSQQATSAPALGELETSSTLPALQNAANPEIAIRQHIAKSLTKNPDQVKQIFATWLAEEV